MYKLLVKQFLLRQWCFYKLSSYVICDYFPVFVTMPTALLLKAIDLIIIYAIYQIVTIVYTGSNKDMDHSNKCFLY